MIQYRVFQQNMVLWISYEVLTIEYQMNKDT